MKGSMKAGTHNLLIVPVVRSSELVVRWERLPQMVTRGEPERLALQQLLYLRPHREAPLKAEVEQVGRGEGQRPFCHQALQPCPPPIEHGRPLLGRGVSWTPEYLRGQNLKATEVQGAILEGTRAEAVSSHAETSGVRTAWAELPGHYLEGPQQDVDVPVHSVRLEHGLAGPRSEGQHGLLVL